MSAVSEIAVGGGGRSLRGPSPLRHSQLERVAQAERPVARLVTFTALALYGVLRWATLLSPAPGARLFGLLALAVCIVAVGAKLDGRSLAVAVAAGVCAFLAMLVIAGIPAGWLLHARVSVISQGIGQGLSALPGVLVPYIGINDWVRVVIVLGAGVLLLDAALMIAFAPRTLGDIRRVGAALPLVALAIVPSTLARPQLPYVQGVILFALLAAFLWSERTATGHLVPAVAVAGLAGLFGVILAPRLDQHHPWVNYQALATSLSSQNVDQFDWHQTYGPLQWPQHGRAVFDVRAAHPDYWKTENLDVFNGAEWAEGAGPVGSHVPSPAQWALHRWTQTLQLTIKQMKTSDVIAAGSAAPPEHVGEGVANGASPGTWTTSGSTLGPGDSYTVSTYSPQPTGSDLAALSTGEYLTSYSVQDFADELTIGLPSNGLTVGRGPLVEFAAFHSGGVPQNVIGPYNVSGTQLIEGSPYARAYALATRLAAGAATPYAFVRSVERSLSQAGGFNYDQNPPVSPYPLESFLFVNKRGYCQQFAGAMALLLRMGGVPARVATGFTPGRYDSSSKQYVVDDTDAHAWVEVWFPNYGWVRFDPTPPAAPAISGGASLLSTIGSTKGAGTGASSGLGSRESRSGARAARSSGGSPVLWIVVGAALAVCLLVIASRLRRRAPPAGGDQLVAELERALARSGRPLSADTTLAALEQRFRSAPAAEDYVRTLRLTRFGGDAQLPSPSQRRALRGQLAAGLGALGRLRAWWALPPRFLN